MTRQYASATIMTFGYMKVVNYGVAQLQHNKQALKPLTAVNLSEQASKMSHFCFQNTLCTQ